MEFRILSNEEVANLKSNAFRIHKQEAKAFLNEIGYEASDKEEFDNVLNTCGKVFETCSKYGLEKLDKYVETSEGKKQVLRDLKEILLEKGDLKSLTEYSQELPKKAHKYKDIIDDTIKFGMKKRSDYNPKYPEVFGDSDKIYIEVQNMYPVDRYIKEYCGELNEFLAPYKKSFETKDVKGNPRIIFNGQEIKPHRNFSQSLNMLDELKKSEIDYQDKQLFSVLRNGNYSGLKAIIRARKEQAKQGGDFKNEELCRAYDKNELFFYTFASKFSKTSYESDEMNFMMARVKAEGFYDDITSKLGFASGMVKSSNDNSEKSVNIISVSKDPYDLATLSAYNAPARTCFHPEGKEVGENKHHVVQSIIEKGGLCIVALDEKLNPVFRSVVASYKNKDGDVIYDINNPTGRCDLDGVTCFNEIAKDVLDDKNAFGSFKRENVEDLFEHQNIAEQVAGFSLTTPVITLLDENKVYDFYDLANKIGVKQNDDGSVPSFKLEKQERRDEIDVDISFPKELKVNGDFVLQDNSKIEDLPNTLDVDGNIVLKNCSALKSLPEGLNVKGNIVIEDCSGMKAIPDFIPDEKIKGLSSDKIKELKFNYTSAKQFFKNLSLKSKTSLR